MEKLIEMRAKRHEGRIEKRQAHHFTQTAETNPVKIWQDLARGKHTWRPTLQHQGPRYAGARERERIH